MLRTFSWAPGARAAAALLLLFAVSLPLAAQERAKRIGAARGGTAQALPAGPQGIAAPSFTDELDAKIDKHFADEKLPGLVVLYARDGLLTYKRVKGKADVAGNVPMSEHKVGRLNSVSKWVGSLVLLKLDEQNKIDLSAKANSYLPELPAHHTYRVIDLLTCRSGVRHYNGQKSDESPNTDWSADDYAKATDAIPNFWHDPLASPVGEYHYSSFGYAISDACAEKVTNKSFRQLVQSTLAGPLNVPSLKVEDLEDNNPQRVKFYTVQNGQNVVIAPPKKEWTPSGGGMESTPLDLLKLGIAYCDGKVVSAASMKKMMTRPNPHDSYCVGASHAVENGYHVLAKSGAAEGSNAYIWMVPERRMVMVVMANRDGAGVSDLGKSLRSILLNQKAAASEDPDLVVEEFARTGPPRYADGKLEIPVRFKVVNQGIAGVNVQFVNSVRVDGKDCWTGFMDALPGKGQAKTVTAVIKIPDAGKLLAGRTLKLEAYADAPIAAADTSLPDYGRVDESNDANNKASLNVEVPGGLDVKADKPAAAPTRVPKNIGAKRVPRLPTP